jgi:hypothetical protein
MAVRLWSNLHPRPLRAHFFSASAQFGKAVGDNPAATQPHSEARKPRSETLHTDKQSNASRNEDKSGDNHPAKQPDYQAKPSRSTGIGGQSEVEEGKQGLGERTNKQKG